MYEFDEQQEFEVEATQVECLDIPFGNQIIYDDMLAYIKSMVDFNSASLLLIKKERRKLQTVAQYGDGCNLIEPMRFKMGNGLSAWLAQRKRTICLSDIHRGARHGHNPTRSFVAIPIVYQDEVIGILNLAHVLPNAFGTKEVETLKNILQSFASQIYNIMSAGQ